MIPRILAIVVGAVLVFPRLGEAACGVERWPVKIASDADASFISLLAMPTTIEMLRALPAPRPLPQERRLPPTENTIYALTTTIVAYRLAPDSDIHLVLADEAGRTIVARIPAPSCAMGSQFLSQITDTRQRFETRYPVTDTFKSARIPVEIHGLGFFDFLQSEQGQAPNGISLHPVIDIDFTPSFQPKPPPTPSRRRAVRNPGGSCTRPTLTLSASQNSVCGGESTTLSWQSSDPKAKVSIDGIGAFLPASGTRTTGVSANTAYAGRASNACGAGNEAVTVVSVKPATTASLNGPATVKEGNSATLTVSIAGATSWTLTSSLGNAISPSSGTSSRSVQYSASRKGTDSITLFASGGGCAPATRSFSISVTANTTTPPPPPSGLLCCDGTRSPTCFSCASKKGCCSSHGGVCGCATAVIFDDTRP
ncbi:MAG TPA: hypothetical protein VF215_16805 [Thermoanaerobaculia bacterium]